MIPKSFEERVRLIRLLDLRMADLQKAWAKRLKQKMRLQRDWGKRRAG